MHTSYKLLDSMINKMADEDDCLSLCSRRPRSHWSKLPHKHTHKHKKNEHVRSSCAYAYVAGVLTCLHMWLVLVLMLTFTPPVYALLKTRLKLIYMS